MNSFRGLSVGLVFLLFFITCYLYLQNQLSDISEKVDNMKQADNNRVKQPIVIYNRVPKTGSTSMMNVVYELYGKNTFRVVQLHVTQYKHMLTLGDQIHFAMNISAWANTPSFYHGHFAYFDPRKLGVDVTPLFINMVRKPLDRLVSHYYFLRYGDDVLVDKVRAKEGDTTTFDECVEKGQSDCDPKKLWIQIPFFCGSSPKCWDPGSEWALAQAKHNLVNKYLLVGVTEELDSFVEVLEELIPDFFKGAKEFLEQSGKSHIKRTRHKDEVSEETNQKMKKTKIWKLENEFYNFALKNFHSVKQVVLEQKRLGIHFYNYEKVRPKS